MHETDAYKVGDIVWNHVGRLGTHTHTHTQVHAHDNQAELSQVKRVAFFCSTRHTMGLSFQDTHTHTHTHTRAQAHAHDNQGELSQGKRSSLFL